MKRNGGKKAIFKKTKKKFKTLRMISEDKYKLMQMISLVTEDEYTKTGTSSRDMVVVKLNLDLF